MARWSTLVVDEASVAQMPWLAAGDVIRHADLVAAQRLRPKQLYSRWEAQQWSAEAIELGRDHRHFHRLLPEAAREQLGEAIATFIIGEYTGLDLLAPILTGAPDEEDLLYLGTQLADETRHTRLMLRMGTEVLGFDSEPRRMLQQAWEVVTPAHRDLSLLESTVVRDLAARPGDYAAWLRAVALFHLVTEGVLALVGQRAIVHALRGVPLLPGVRTGFVAMCRDESRHVSFGLHALRQGVQEGYADEICDVLDTAAPIALRIGAEGAAARAGDDPLARLSVDSLRRHLRLIGVDAGYTEHLIASATAPAPVPVPGPDHHPSQRTTT